MSNTVVDEFFFSTKFFIMVDELFFNTSFGFGYIIRMTFDVIDT